jgi:excinuclease UvrABC nuclease subunit
MVGRRLKKKGFRYFGPYPHAGAAIRETVDLLLRVVVHLRVLALHCRKHEGFDAALHGTST